MRCGPSRTSTLTSALLRVTCLSHPNRMPFPAPRRPPPLACHPRSNPPQRHSLLRELPRQTNRLLPLRILHDRRDPVGSSRRHPAERCSPESLAPNTLLLKRRRGSFPHGHDVASS